MGQSAIKKAMTFFEDLNSDPETARLAELKMKKILDDRSMINGAMEDGKEAGRIEAKREIAQNALRMGSDIAFVSAITELTEDQVIEIQEAIANR